MTIQLKHRDVYTKRELSTLAEIPLGSMHKRIAEKGIKRAGRRPIKPGSKVLENVYLRGALFILLDLDPDQTGTPSSRPE